MRQSISLLDESTVPEGKQTSLACHGGASVLARPLMARSLIQSDAKRNSNGDDGHRAKRRARFERVTLSASHFSCLGAWGNGVRARWRCCMYHHVATTTPRAGACHTIGSWHCPASWRHCLSLNKACSHHPHCDHTPRPYPSHNSGGLHRPHQYAPCHYTFITLFLGGAPWRGAQGCTRA